MDVLLYILFVFLGIAFGILTGLTPGFHVNNVAIIALSIYAATKIDAFLLANMIVANMITHTFLDFIPSTFLGAPSEDTSLSVLPMHRLLLHGQGYRAVYISTFGSLLATLFAMPLIPLFKIALIDLNLSNYLTYYTPVILVAIILGILYMESKKGLKYIALASLIFILSGIFGYLALNIPLNNNYMPLRLTPNTLFPVFTGLFGIPVLILSQHTEVPEQKIEKVHVLKKHYFSSMIGTLTGSLVGFLPGVTSGVAAVLSRLFVKNDDTEDFIFALGSVNTSNYIFNLLALFLILKPRSGAVNAISQMITVNLWNFSTLPPGDFVIILLTVVIASIASFFITLKIGKFVALKIGNIGSRYGLISRAMILTLGVLIFIFSGTIGLFLAVVATLIGLLPPKLGTMRVHLMGVIILPALLAYL
ncbi:putative membrane protein [Aciduliprofundum sp. MAR08-339]|uniref:tripartite tricarboxylate transporter permease n=1 Tax=Aciduliprofundum sp. (strain MAR08-339) TaxID=673860 RepID=UPI0002A49492|nr:putative membrane protein [Aciduliprofundum sp. MAR08-339]